MLIRGPAIVEIKRPAKELCLSQGFKEHEVPMYLRDRPLPSDYDEQLQRLYDRGWRSSVMILMNDTGYGEKKATVQRAVMYNLAPKASVLLAMDSLWLSDVWAAMFISAALRGAHVYAVAPSPANAPASSDLILFLMRENLDLLFRAGEYFKEDLDAVDGAIHVGLYNHDYGSDDPVARASTFLAKAEQRPFITEDFPFQPDVYDVVREFVNDVRRVGKERGIEVTRDEEVRPFLHMKTQFFATEVGLDILRQKDWAPIVKRFGEIRLKQYLGEENPGMTPRALVDIDSTTGLPKLLVQFDNYLTEHRPDDRDNMMYAFTIGSMNQDRRGMLSDGEVLAVLGGYTALIGVVDMFGLATSATWPETQEEFDALFPEPRIGTRAKRLGRYLQDFF
jgi:hypothetical protein